MQLLCCLCLCVRVVLGCRIHGCIHGAKEMQRTVARVQEREKGFPLFKSQKGSFLERTAVGTNREQQLLPPLSHPLVKPQSE